MKHLFYLLFTNLIFSFSLFSQQDTLSQEYEREGGHFNTNKFRQLYDEWATPNSYRTAAGSPGHEYYQQQADYIIDVELKEGDNPRIYGEETIVYTNNSPDNLTYLWVQLDQNIRKKDSPSLQIEAGGISPISYADNFVSDFLEENFDGGFNIDWVKDNKENPLKYTINQTMMRIELPTPLKKGGKFSFSIKWWYNVNNHVTNRARSGYEYFAEDDNRAFVIAQFYPRMALYNDVEGWQNYQFWGDGEFALTFGNFEVNITVPSNHIVDATGVLQNRKNIFTKEMLNRYETAQTSFDKPVFIVTQEEAEKNEKKDPKGKTKTWKFEAQNVRDFAFASSPKFIWDMMAVKLNNEKTVMAVSLYPKEGNPLWEEYSTITVASTLKSYSKYTFSYPYHKAISVHAKNQGMEYPMICWNYGRPEKDGTYSDRTKFGMVSVIIHEIGHNFFPMIVNSDERQWGWMDEGINTFLQFLAEQDFAKKYPKVLKGNKDLEKYPSRRGYAKDIIPYMSYEQDFLAPIMSNPENVYQLGPNAYGKPATALNILRETIMGKELFDYAFKTYSQRWMFKHPTPEDFFRTMEDASAVDLDWFWRGWFYSTDYVDIEVSSVKEYYVSQEPSQKVIDLLAQYGMTLEKIEEPVVFMVDKEDKVFQEKLEKESFLDNSTPLKSYLFDNFTEEERKNLNGPKYFYEIEFKKPGGLVMPIIVEYTYEDGTKKRTTYPAQIWRKNDDFIKKIVPSSKKIVRIIVDPDLKTADIDTSNNVFPSREETDIISFEEFKQQAKN